MPFSLRSTLLLLVAFAALGWAIAQGWRVRTVPAGRSRVIFWHFWGGAERQVVQDVVRRFNASQTEFHVEEIAIPGQNLDMKFYMAAAGGDPPDVLNQDDPVVGQWAHRGVITPLRDIAPPGESERLAAWLSPAARRIGTYEGELYALCNGLDIRAMLYRAEALDGRPPPRTLAEFDALARRPGSPQRLSFLPDDRRLWAWATAFGGEFYDEATGRITANDPRIVTALEWMASYSRFHGLEAIQTFRANNREAGAGSPLLQGRFDMMLDGQWRVAELDAAEFDYDVGPLPVPEGGRENAGWVNGNFFLVPRGCRNPRGAWAFMTFWAGYGHEREAAKTAAAGGWIPPSPHVAKQPEFQAYLREHPHFAQFVELAGSPNQWPTPNIPVQAYFFDRVNRATEEARSLRKSPQEALDEATRDVQARLDTE